MSNPSELIEEFEEKLISSGLATKRSISGCSEKEIIKLEKHYDVRLPIIYKEFLFKMGFQAGEFYQGTDIFYNQVFGNREALTEVLQEDDYQIDLPQSIFVFSSHQGYIFHFFNAEQNVFDPPVFGYKEEDLKIKKISETFSSFLFGSLADFVKIRKKR